MVKNGNMFSVLVIFMYTTYMLYVNILLYPYLMVIRKSLINSEYTACNEENFKKYLDVYNLF